MLTFQTSTLPPAAWLPDMVGIYRLAFALPPYSKREEEVIYFERTLPEHVQRPGFRMVAARMDDRLVGYAYGYTCAPHYYWTTEVSKWMTPTAAAEWLADAFHLSEMALLPECHGRGIGGELHDRILLGLANRTAVLSTIAAVSKAYHLYRNRDWEVLVDKFTPPGMARAYRVMGLRLEQGIGMDNG